MQIRINSKELDHLPCVIPYIAPLFVGIEEELHGEGPGVSLHELQGRPTQSGYGDLGELVRRGETILVRVKKDLNGISFRSVALQVVALDSCLFQLHGVFSLKPPIFLLNDKAAFNDGVDLVCQSLQVKTFQAGLVYARRWGPTDILR